MAPRRTGTWPTWRPGRHQPGHLRRQLRHRTVPLAGHHRRRRAVAQPLHPLQRPRIRGAEPRLRPGPRQRGLREGRAQRRLARPGRPGDRRVRRRPTSGAAQLRSPGVRQGRSRRRRLARPRSGGRQGRRRSHRPAGHPHAGQLGVRQGHARRRRLAEPGGAGDGRGRRADPHRHRHPVRRRLRQGPPRLRRLDPADRLRHGHGRRSGSDGPHRLHPDRRRSVREGRHQRPRRAGTTRRPPPHSCASAARGW